MLSNSKRMLKGIFTLDNEWKSENKLKILYYHPMSGLIGPVIICLTHECVYILYVREVLVKDIKANELFRRDCILGRIGEETAVNQ